LAPPLPSDIAVSFYIQSHKLIFAVYQVTMVHGALKFDTSQAECSVPWLNEVLVLLTVGLQTCQQLKDKVNIYSILVRYIFINILLADLRFRPVSRFPCRIQNKLDHFLGLQLHQYLDF